MENYFAQFRNQIIGIKKSIKTPYFESIPLIYGDWTASGRNYQRIEDKISKDLMPVVANTHTETNFTGMSMTYAYHKAQQIIKKHVNAGESDVLISCGSGMTGVVNKFQRILGLKIHESFKGKVDIDPSDRPVIFITHMEHHSNQTSWLETIGEVVIIPPCEKGLVSIENFKQLLESYSHRKKKIAAVTSCSNVTGILTPYQDIAQLIHQHNGLCFVDFACSAPYVTMDMHENDAEGRYLDAVYFSPHKFLGGPGTTGVLIFNASLYSNEVPDCPGGGTVTFTNPWGEHTYLSEIELREDGGTPPFLQVIKAAMCMQLKDKMGVANIQKREDEIMTMLWEGLGSIPNLHILAAEHKHRLGIISFYIDELNYNVGVRMLNDRFGIQTRGGCSCAGTYGHYLYNVDEEKSESMKCSILSGDQSVKPGWIRLSIHPTHTNAEIQQIINAITALAANFNEWSDDYFIERSKGEVKHKSACVQAAMQTNIDFVLSEDWV